ncbi:MAG: hypothetical protein RR945_05720 [Erysipelotrichaceae bacterium]
MQRSKYYEEFINQSLSRGKQKLEGYNPNLLSLITIEERDDIETEIVNIFLENKDYDLAAFFPKLKNYDGISILKENLKNWEIPSDGSVAIAFALFDATNDSSFLTIIDENFKLSVKLDKVRITAQYSYHTPNKKIFEKLMKIYLNEDDKTVRNTAVIGLLYNCNLIINPLDTNELQKKIDLRRKFNLENKSQRLNILNEIIDKKSYNKNSIDIYR